MKTPLIVALVLLIGGVGGFFTYQVARGGSDAPELDPAPVNPAVVARVNGVDIPGRLVDILEANGNTDAFDAAIDQELLVQAGQRLGLEATPEEAREEVRRLEQEWRDASVDTRLEVEAGLQAQGLPTSGLADDPRFVEAVRRNLTSARARGFVATQAGAEPDQREAAVKEFLAQERAGAIIIDCRVEDCP